ncbi:MAG: alkaline phosphatase family protein, partial [Bacteroidetes bacterium]|nr:alkaline phosphatase family protein [Bacteroidota bacterium]
MKRITFLSLLIALSFSLSSHYCSRLSPEQYQVSPERYKTEYVVILVIDGPRYTETYGEKSQKYIPFLRDSLIPNGVFFESFYNNRVTLTVSGHAAITTGRYQTLRNSGQDIPRHPGIFHNFSNQYPEWQKQTWLLTSKGKLEVLADSKKSGKANGLNVYCGIDGKGAGYASDHLIMKKIESVLDKESPKLMLINLLDVDV